MKNLKSFILGAACMLILVSLGTAAYAAVTGSTIDIVGGIKLFLYGEPLEMTDVSGNPVKPFIHDGTAYVPARGLSEALGKSAAWDSGSKAVYIDEPLSSEERLGISKIVFRDFYFGQVLIQYTVDFLSCQLTGESDYSGAFDDSEPYYSSSYVPSEKQTEFFEAADKYGLLNWNDPDWEWYGPGAVMMILDGFSYDISVIMDDGTERKSYGHEDYPANWNEMREAFKELTGKYILTYPAPALTLSESMQITKITVDCLTPTEDRYEIDTLYDRYAHSYLDAETGQRTWESIEPGRESLLTFFDAFRENEVMRWNDDSREWKVEGADSGEYRILIEYYSDVPQYENSPETYPGLYLCEYELTVGGEAGYPENWDTMKESFLEMIDAQTGEASS